MIKLIEKKLDLEDKIGETSIKISKLKLGNLYDILCDSHFKNKSPQAVGCVKFDWKKKEEVLGVSISVDIGDDSLEVVNGFIWENQDNSLKIDGPWKETVQKAIDTLREMAIKFYQDELSEAENGLAEIEKTRQEFIEKFNKFNGAK